MPKQYSRRSRRRPLREFAERSLLHAFAVWMLQTAIYAVAALAVFVFVMNVAVPKLVDGFTETKPDAISTPTATASPR